MKEDKNVVDFTSVRKVKEFVNRANDRIGELEHALYTILELTRVDVIKETAADVLNEDLDVYLEGDTVELDFEAEAEFGFEGDWVTDDNR